LLDREGLNFERWIVGAEQTGRLSDVSRSETGSGSVAHAGVERDADDNDIGTADLVQTRQPRIGRWSRKAGHHR
jgi:hypothetical protein